MSDWELVLLAIGIVAFAGVLIAIGVRYLERNRNWRAKVGRLQGRLVADLAHDRTLAGMSFVPEVSVNADGVTKVTVLGVVPTPADRTRVLRAVERESARLFPGAYVEDALQAEQPSQRAAG